jgi:hypothetical protein
MSFIPAAELSQIQNDAVAAVCDKQCFIYRKTTTVGATGEPIGTYTLLYETVAGINQPVAGLLQNYSLMLGSLAVSHVKLPTGTNIQHQDHLVIENHTLEVQVVLTPQSYSVFTNVLASEVV